MSKNGNSGNRPVWNRGLSRSLCGVVLASLTVAQLTQCAPKDKHKSESPQTKTGGATAPKVPGAAAADPQTRANPSIVEGLDFSQLEATTSMPTAKNMYERLKKGEEIPAHILAMALMEMHLKAAGEASGSDQQTEKLGALTTQVANLKITKLEELKALYTNIEKEKSKNMRYSSEARTVLSVINSAEVQAYSGTSFLGLAALESPDLDFTKILVLIEEGEIKLGEVRHSRLMAVNSLTKSPVGAVAQDVGTVAEYIKSPKHKLMELEGFVIHEVLKSFAKDKKAWAVRVQQRSNKNLSLQVEDSRLLLAQDVDLKKLDHSEIMIGKPKQDRAEDLRQESKKVVVDGVELSDEKILEFEKKSAIQLNGECKLQSELSISLKSEQDAAAVVSLSAEALMKFAADRFVFAADGQKLSLITLQLKGLSESELGKSLTPADPQLMRRVEQMLSETATKAGKDSEYVLKILLLEAKPVESEILMVLKDHELEVPQKVKVTQAAIDLLKTKGLELKSKDRQVLVVAERKASCEAPAQAAAAADAPTKK